MRARHAHLRTTLSLGVAATAFVLASCSSSNSGDGNSDGDGGAMATSAATVAPAAGSTIDGGSPVTSPVPTGDAFCDADAAGQAVGDLSTFATASSDVIATNVTAMVAAADAMRAAAPDEIAADVDTVMDVQSTLAALIAEHDYDFQALALDPKVSALLTDMTYIEAGRRLKTFVDARCHPG